MGALLGLLTSFSITTSEMFGRTVAKNIGPLVLTAATSLVGAVVAAGAAFVLGGHPTFGDMALGGISGVGFGFGMLSYFIGLNASSSAVVSPTVAALTTIIPFTWGAIARDVPPVLAFMGAIAAIVGLMFVTIGGDEASNVRHGLLWGLASGLGYGFGSAVLIEVAVDAGAWPAVSQRGFSLLLVIGLVTAQGSRLLPSREFMRPTLFSGFFGGLSSILLLAAFRRDPAAASVTASLFPATSVAGGRVFFSDSVTPAQVVGLVIVLAGVVAIVVA